LLFSVQKNTLAIFVQTIINDDIKKLLSRINYQCHFKHTGSPKHHLFVTVLEEECHKAWWLYYIGEASLYTGEQGCSPPPRVGTKEGEAQPPRAGAQGVEPPVPILPLYPNGMVVYLYT
jgi:hypothetical protein